MNVPFDTSRLGLTRSVGEAFDRALADPALAEGPRQRLACSRRKLAQVFGDLDALVGNEAELRARTAAVAPRRFGIGPKRWRNVCNDLFLVLRRAGLGARRIKDMPVDPAWEAALALVSGKYHQDNLLPFARFCSGRGIGPAQVSDAVILAYQEARAAEGVREAWNSSQTAVRLWNRAVHEVPGFPQVRLAPLVRRVTLSLPLDAFPESFRRELEAYLACLQSDDPFDPKAPPKPLRDRSIAAKRMQIRRAASELVRLGHAPAAITGLAYLVEPERFQQILKALYLHAGRRPRSWIYDHGHTLLSMARHWLGVDAATLKPLVALNARFRTAQTGLTARNREKLRQFDDATVDRFVRWPEAEMRGLLRRDNGKRRTAERFQVALAIEILLFTLLRVENLATLVEGKNLHWRQGSRDDAFLVAIRPEQVKNEQAIQILVPASVGHWVRIYRERFRPRLLRPGGDPDALFPGDGRGCKRADTLSGQIRDTLKRELGLVANPHLFRHLGALLVLRENPAAYNLVSRLLAHKSIETAFRHYSGEEIEQAFKLWDALLRRARQRGDR